MGKGTPSQSTSIQTDLIRLSSSHSLNEIHSAIILLGRFVARQRLSWTADNIIAAKNTVSRFHGASSGHGHVDPLCNGSMMSRAHAYIGLQFLQKGKFLSVGNMEKITQISSLVVEHCVNHATLASLCYAIRDVQLPTMLECDPNGYSLVRFVRMFDPKFSGIDFSEGIHACDPKSHACLLKMGGGPKLMAEILNATPDNFHEVCVAFTDIGKAVLKASGLKPSNVRHPPDSCSPSSGVCMMCEGTRRGVVAGSTCLSL